jgi:hypothetical protein
VIDYEAIAAAGGFGKGSTKKVVKSAKQDAHRTVVAAVRAEVFRLDTRCVVCLGPPTPDDAMHEVRPRSKTRGLPPAQRFNRQNCVRVHDGPGRSCHRWLTGDLGVGKAITMAFLDAEQGVDGGLLIQKADGTAVIYRRDPPRHQPVQSTTVEAGAAVDAAEQRGRQDKHMVSMPIVSVRVSPIRREGVQAMTMTAGEPPVTEEAQTTATTTVQKPVPAPKRKPARTGTPAVTKAVSAEPPGGEERRKEDRRSPKRVMVTLFSQSSRDLVLKMALHCMMQEGLLSDDERRQASQLADRISAKPRT